MNSHHPIVPFGPDGRTDAERLLADMRARHEIERPQASATPNEVQRPKVKETPMADLMSELRSMRRELGALRASAGKTTPAEARKAVVAAINDPETTDEEKKHLEAVLAAYDSDEEEEGLSAAQARALDRAMPVPGARPTGPVFGSGNVDLARDYVRRRDSGRA